MISMDVFGTSMASYAVTIVVSTLWSTSELTVCLHVHRLTSGLKRGTARVMAVTGQEADERVGDARKSDAFLPFVFGPFGQAPYTAHR